MNINDPQCEALVETEEEELLESKLSWYKEFKTIASSASSVMDIFPLVIGFKSLLSGKQYSLVDKLLLEVEPESYSTTALVTLARTVSPARGKLKNWDAYIDKIKMTLDDRGEDSQKALRGLVEDRIAPSEVSDG